MIILSDFWCSNIAWPSFTTLERRENEIGLFRVTFVPFDLKVDCFGAMSPPNLMRDSIQYKLLRSTVRAAARKMRSTTGKAPGKCIHQVVIIIQ